MLGTWMTVGLGQVTDRLQAGFACGCGGAAGTGGRGVLIGSVCGC